MQRHGISAGRGQQRDCVSLTPSRRRLRRTKHQRCADPKICIRVSPQIFIKPCTVRISMQSVKSLEGKSWLKHQHISRYRYRSISEIYRDIDINIDYRNSTNANKILRHRQAFIFTQLMLKVKSFEAWYIGHTESYSFFFTGKPK